VSAAIRIPPLALEVVDREMPRLPVVPDGDRPRARIIRLWLPTDGRLGYLGLRTWAVTLESAPRRRLAFAAVGASTSGRGAAESDEMLAEGFGRD
jgi:hypothetical protein